MDRKAKEFTTPALCRGSHLVVMTDGAGTPRGDEAHWLPRSVDVRAALLQKFISIFIDEHPESSACMEQ